ncbi:MAG: hypothetical protein GY829_06690, partial [Gammaproteobacteria bacterium]|nr:hypothetical protein [Gammaproteobacteria bacterium]
MKSFNYFIITLLFLISGCSQKPVMKPPPLGLSLSGTWTFDKQDEQSIQYLINRINHVPLYIGSGNFSQRKQQMDSRNLEQNMLRDLLLGLFTVVPKEIYILQTDDQISIDFGVAGYHTFDLLTKTEVVLDGFKIDSYAGWKGNEFILQLNLGHSYQLLEKLTLINNNQQLLETIELKFLD